ncbi:MAG: glycoside hydrolase 43 family protein [Rhodobacterales bacterium]|nr:MAG: glycoside hydrolase 43 family protein [Rhodobacterales bacterium]
MIRNPVLPGSNPDPSICRVGEDYYIATSTFEWYPGVQIHHSRDLVNWRLVARPLNRASLLDMRGNPDSGGVWAPCLSHDDERFWLAYSNVRRIDGAFKDVQNFITSCKTVEGTWCDPWYVNSSGFDPSLFHDRDGRKYVLNMLWNHRGPGSGRNPAHDRFDGIVLQQWSPEAGLTGPVHNIWAGTSRGLTEAPHLFRHGDYYYLTTAEGGTGYGHAVSMARARRIEGPYEPHPAKHLICNAADPSHPIQRTGHGQYVETPDGQVYHSFLMGRPIPGPDGHGRFCPLGRETGLERCAWGGDGWLYLETGGTLVRETLPGLADVEPAPPARVDYRFDRLHEDFQWLRTPEPDRIFRCEDGALVLTGRESIGSWFEQALVARRQQHFRYAAECWLDFEPENYQQAAGLTTYYNASKFHALLLSHEPRLGRTLSVISCQNKHNDGFLDYALRVPIPIGEGPVELGVRVDHATQRFFWRREGSDWKAIGPALDAAAISDEGGRGEHGSFTGAFVGMLAFDLSGQAAEARFTSFSYDPT